MGNYQIDGTVVHLVAKQTNLYNSCREMAVQNNLQLHWEFHWILQQNYKQIINDLD